MVWMQLNHPSMVHRRCCSWSMYGTGTLVIAPLRHVCLKPKPVSWTMSDEEKTIRNHETWLEWPDRSSFLLRVNLRLHCSEPGPNWTFMRARLDALVGSQYSFEFFDDFTNHAQGTERRLDRLCTTRDQELLGFSFLNKPACCRALMKIAYSIED